MATRFPGTQSCRRTTWSSARHRDLQKEKGFDLYGEIAAVLKRSGITRLFCLLARARPEQRIYTEDDIRVEGGLNGVEQQLQREAYWYGRVGEVKGMDTGMCVTFDARAFAGIAIPSRSELLIGHPHPAFHAGQLERYPFDAVCDGIDRLLNGWKRKEDDDIVAYVIKQVYLSRKQIERLIRTMYTGRDAYEVIGVTALKYWYKSEWLDHSYEEDLCLGLFPFTVPMAIKWARGKGIIDARALPICPC